MKKHGLLAAGALVLAGMLAVPVLAAEEAEVTGTWYLNTVFLDGAEITPGLIGLEVSIVLNEDGSSLLELTEEDPVEGTWKIEEEQVIVTIDNEPAAFTLRGDTLAGGEDNIILVFGRELKEFNQF